MLRLLALVCFVTLPSFAAAKASPSVNAFFRGFEVTREEFAPVSNAALAGKIASRIEAHGLSLTNAEEHGLTAHQLSAMLRNRHTVMPSIYFDVVVRRPDSEGRFDFDILYVRGTQLLVEQPDKKLTSCRGKFASDGSLAINISDCIRSPEAI